MPAPDAGRDDRADPRASRRTRSPTTTSSAPASQCPRVAPPTRPQSEDLADDEFLAAFEVGLFGFLLLPLWLIVVGVMLMRR